jgi:ABC-type branched-subunit amino acid transport system substrate-binding protein
MVHVTFERSKNAKGTKIICLKTAILVCITVLALCIQAPTVSWAAGDTVRIGCLIPFTGVETHNGLSMRYGAEIARDEVNAAGGVNGKKIELFPEDTGCLPDVAVQKAQKMIRQDKCDLLVGTLSSAETYAVFDLSQRSKIIFMNPTFYTGALQGKYFFSTGATPNQVIFPLIDYATQAGKKTYYFVGSDYVWPRGSIAAAKRHIQSVPGAKVLGEEYAPFGTTDFSSIIRRIEASNAQIVVPFVAGLDGATFMKQLADFGVMKKVLVLSDYFDELLIPALTPDQVAGVINTSTYYSFVDTPANKAFKEKLAKYDSKAVMSNFGMGMYLNVKLYAAAANKAKTTDKEKVISSLGGLSIDGLTGKVTLTKGTQHAIQNVYLAEIQRDKSFKLIKVFEQVVPEIEKWKQQ